MINERNLARHAHNFELADAIRLKLDKKGIILEDSNNKTIWKLKNGR